MRRAIVVDANDIKKILAEHFNVSQDCVFKSQYSYTVITEGDVETTESTANEEE